MPKKTTSDRPELNPVNVGAAAVDIGSKMHMAAVNPACTETPVRAFGTFAWDGLHPEQLLKIDGLALGFQLRGAFLGRLHKRLRRRRHGPSSGSELSAIGASPDDRRFAIREDARHRGQVANIQRADRSLVRSDTAEVAQGVISGAAWWPLL